MNRRAIVIQAPKGGCGKSHVARLLIDLGRARGRTISAHDLDFGTGSLARIYRDNDPKRGVGIISFTDTRNFQWFDALGDPQADDVIYDVPGGRSQAFANAFSGRTSTMDNPNDILPATAMMDEIKRTKRELVIVTPITNMGDSISGLDATWKLWPDATHVIIKNGFYGDDPVRHFPIFEGREENGVKRFGKMRERADANGTVVLYLPRLSPDSNAVADEEGLTLTQAADRSEEGKLHSLLALRTQAWLIDASEAIANSPIDMPEPQAKTKASKTPRETETVAS